MEGGIEPVSAGAAESVALVASCKEAILEYVKTEGASRSWTVLLQMGPDRFDD